MATKTSSTPASQNVPTWKTIAVIGGLIIFWPLGLALMIAWMKWPIWAKIVIPIVMAFVALIFFSFFATFLLALINPQGKVELARMNACSTRCEGSTDKTCFNTCLDSFKISPAPTSY